MATSFKIFPGKASDALTTVMPAMNEWLEQSLSEIDEVREPDDHAVIVWVNLPTQGILGAHKRDWVVTYLTSVLQKYKRNGMAILVHSNRASQNLPGNWVPGLNDQTQKDFKNMSKFKVCR